MKEKPGGKYDYFRNGTVSEKESRYIPSYLTDPHPEGDLGSNTLIVDGDCPMEVLYWGYEDEDDFDNLKRKVDDLEKEEPEKAKDTTEPEKAETASVEQSETRIPFQKYRKHEEK